MYSLLITFFILAIVISFLCSLWEAVLLSITPSYAQLKLREESAIGKHLEEFKKNIDRPLAAILTLNTIAHTVGAIGVGDQSAKIWSHANPIITTLAIPAFMTVMILILSEIIPKTIGATFWKKLTPFTVRSLIFIMLFLRPFVWVSQFITRLVKDDKSQSILSRKDFLAITEIGTEQGIFHEDESRIISNLIRFNSIKTRDIMTPRTVVKAVSENMTFREFFDSNRSIQFSRIPVFKKSSKDQICGYVLKQEILSELLNKNDTNRLSSIKRDIMAIEENASLADAFDQFFSQREHIALVVDEFGGMAGIVTMEDIIETLLGLEIVDESDSIEDMQQLARKNWKKRAESLGLIKSELPDK